MKKNVRKGDIKALAAALNDEQLGLSDVALRAVAGGRMADKTDVVTSAGVTRCCWG